jgi:hypothetical protein
MRIKNADGLNAQKFNSTTSELSFTTTTTTTTTYLILIIDSE